MSRLPIVGKAGFHDRMAVIAQDEKIRSKDPQKLVVCQAIHSERQYWLVYVTYFGHRSYRTHFLLHLQ
jgi:hypothetical protein